MSNLGKVSNEWPLKSEADGRRIVCLVSLDLDNRGSIHIVCCLPFGRASMRG